MGHTEGLDKLLQQVQDRLLKGAVNDEDVLYLAASFTTAQIRQDILRNIIEIEKHSVTKVKGLFKLLTEEKLKELKELKELCDWLLLKMPAETCAEITMAQEVKLSQQEAERKTLLPSPIVDLDDDPRWQSRMSSCFFLGLY